MLATVSLLVFSALLGLALGSYLNSWVWRAHLEVKDVGKRSVCVSCRRILLWYENIPFFSYLFLCGRCRSCHAPIPIDYVIVEAVTGGLLAFVVYFHSVISPLYWINLYRDIFFVAILVVIFVYDLKYMIILPSVIVAGSIVGLFFNYWLHFNLVSLLTGSILGGSFFLIQFLVSKGRWVGGGDVMLGFMMGLWLGWQNMLVALFVAYVVGSFIALPMLLLKKKNMQSEIPFGTFLAVGAFVALIWGDSLVGWYKGLIGII